MGTWLDEALVYAVDVRSFADSDGDGLGDLAGVTAHLDHIASLDVTCIWLQPFYPSPGRDDGYDVVDHLSVHPGLGTVEDLQALVEAAHDRDIRVLAELVGSHTSIDHPWFRSHPERYVWRDRRDPGASTEPEFPGVSDSVWHHDEEARAWYLARFYPDEPDLATWRDDVLDELEKAMKPWSNCGIDGFRVDAAAALVEKAAWADPAGDGLWVLERLHESVSRCGQEVVLVGETDVEPERYEDYLAEDRCEGVFDFFMNNCLFLAMATGDARPLRDAVGCRRTCPDGARLQWVRNHDQLDLDRLDASDRQRVLDAFDPDRARPHLPRRGPPAALAHGGR